MLPARNRMRASDQFAETVRRGSRSGARRLVVHLRLAEHSASTDQDGAAVLVGFVVPKTVGTAVRRNLVRRRLRSLMRERATGLPPGTKVVVRALPVAAEAGYDTLSTDLDAALAGALRKATGRSEGRAAVGGRRG